MTTQVLRELEKLKKRMQVIFDQDELVKKRRKERKKLNGDDKNNCKNKNCK